MQEGRGNFWGGKLLFVKKKIAIKTLLKKKIIKK
jgi:hypothetical protein